MLIFAPERTTSRFFSKPSSDLRQSNCGAPLRSIPARHSSFGDPTPHSSDVFQQDLRYTRVRRGMHVRHLTLRQAYCVQASVLDLIVGHLRRFPPMVCITIPKEKRSYSYEARSAASFKSPGAP